MTAATTRRARLGRDVTVLGLLLAALGGSVVGVPAFAAGTGGIEVTPVPSQRDGKAITTFSVDVPHEGAVDVPYLLRNVEDGPRSARVYAARVTRNDGNFALDDAGSSPYVSMPDREVTLQQGEVLEEFFRVTPGPDGPPDGDAYAAVVVEVRNGSVVQRASTLIYLDAERRVSLPWLLVVLAVLLLVAAAVGWFGLVWWRRRRATSDQAEA